MQIQSSLYGLGAALATRGGIAADSDAHGAGFASLLLQQNQAAKAPAPVPSPAQPPSSPVQSPAPKPAASGEAPARQAEAIAPATAKAEPPAAASASDASPEPTATATPDSAAGSAAATGTDTRTLLRNKLRAADSSSRSGGADKSDAAASDPLATNAAADKTKDAGAPGSTVDPALTPLAANLPPPTPLPAPGSADTAAAAQDKGKGSDSGATDKSRPAAEALSAKRDAALQAAAADPAATTRTDAAAMTQSTAQSAFAALLSEHQTESTPASRAAAIDGSAAVGVNASAFGPAPTAGTQAPQAVEVPTPVNAPDFAQQLGVQVSVLAKDGIQHAELHLNPADMGPVSVQITLDGTQARVDFGAEVAATRHAIETGLPALASALADAGFTLAGGGVSQHAAGGGRGDGSGSGSGEGSRRTSPVDAAEATSSAASRVMRRTVSAGGVDLYA